MKLLFVILFSTLCTQLYAETSIAVLNIKADKKQVSLDDAVSITDFLTTEVAEIDGIKVLSWDDIKKILEHEGNKQSIGCDDESCLSEIGGSLGVDYILAGNIGRLGNRYLMTVKLIDIEKAETKARVTKKVKNDIGLLADEIPNMVIELMSKGIEINVSESEKMMYAKAKAHQKREEWKEAFEIAKAGTNKGFPSLINFLGFCYAQGYGVTKNVATAVKYYEVASGKGNAKAHFNLGSQYLNGEFLTQDNKKAFNLFKRSASQGFEMGEYYLGYMYLNGLGTSVNVESGIKWYKKASKKYSYAYAELGNLYRVGSVVTLDYYKAKEFYQKGADQDEVWSIVNLGYLYDTGLGVTADLKKAFKLHMRGAKLGHQVGEYNLANSYLNGRGCVKDIGKAKYWYQKSANQGYTQAQTQLNLLK